MSGERQKAWRNRQSEAWRSDENERMKAYQRTQLGAFALRAATVNTSAKHRGCDGKIKAADIFAAWLDQNGFRWLEVRCAICGEVTDQWDVDHVTPLSLGGDHDPDNIQIVCRSCHDVKSSDEKRRRRLAAVEQVPMFAGAEGGKP